MMDLDELIYYVGAGAFVSGVMVVIAVMINAEVNTYYAEDYCKANGYNELEGNTHEGRCVKLIPRSDGVGFDKQYSGYFDYDDIKGELQ